MEHKTFADNKFAQFRGVPVLVVGSTGYLGRHLTQRLIDLGSKVTVLAQKQNDNELLEDFAGKGVRVFLGDMVDLRSMRQAMDGQQYVFNVAGRDPRGWVDKDIIIKANILGCGNVVEASIDAGVRRVIHCSTVSVLGHITQPPADETTPCNPRGLYEWSKSEGEKVVLSRALGQSSTEVVVIRSAMIWGENDERVKRLFSAVCKRKVRMIGNGKVSTHWIYVDDLVEAFLLAAITPGIGGEIFILAGSAPISVKNLITLIAQMAGVETLRFNIPGGPAKALARLLKFVATASRCNEPEFVRRVEWFTKERSYNTDKARTMLKFCPKQTVQEEAQAIFTWIKHHGWLD